MPSADASPSPRYQALYTATVKEAASRGGPIMSHLVAAARQALQVRAAASKELRVRDALSDAAQSLMTHEADLCKRYPVALLAAFENPDVATGSAVAPTVQFDQLELMDEAQVQTSVVMAKAQQGALLAAEASLAELNTLLCTTLGLSVVKPERNPLMYLSSLKEVVDATRVPQIHRTEWFGAMHVALGGELSKLYESLSANLRVEEVAPAGYAVLQTPGGPGGGRSHTSTEEPTDQSAQEQSYAQAVRGGAGHVSGRASASPVARATQARARSGNEALLTLDKLRRLLSGELDAQPANNRVADFSRQFAKQFDAAHQAPEAPASDFEATVPAAFEALTEMKQASQVVARLEQRRDGVAPANSEDNSVAGLREFLRRTAAGVAQALSLEVVTLMVANIARDPQLLPPIQNLVRELESPLLLLALVDPRFFTDKQHPARLLLQEITHRSMAFESEESSGFADYLNGVQKAIAPLQNATIDNAEPFELVLTKLHADWHQAAKTKDVVHEAAVQALQHAEQRNLLAEKIACKIVAHPDADSVPVVVIEFLCGPWAQVVAQARIVGGADSSAADKYQALISAMLWSAHPELTRKNTKKLTRLVPLLLSTVREGLETIHYPPTKTSAFLEALMGLHQLAFRASTLPPDVAQAPGLAPTPVPETAVSSSSSGSAAAALGRLVEDGNPWVAAQEAQASNFMEMPELRPATSEGAQASVGDDWPLGTWVELLVNGKWVRTQLTWASPHGTLFLFTSVFGSAQSMTRRLRDKLVASGSMRVVSNQTVVDGALDAVAQMAMRNSIDVAL